MIRMLRAGGCVCYQQRAMKLQTSAELIPKDRFSSTCSIEKFVHHAFKPEILHMWTLLKIKHCLSIF